jgi:SAM-dependent methyltransferase
MRIDWVVEGIKQDESGRLVSDLATNRYRAILPAQALSALGHEVRFLNIQKLLDPSRPMQADVLVVGKFLPGSDAIAYDAMSRRLLDRLRQIAGNHTRIVADFNDDHFDHPVQGHYWRSLARIAQVVVVGSDMMGQRVRQFTAAPIVVVGDPIASPLSAPRTPDLPVATGWLQKLLPSGVNTRPRLKLLWYGQPVNWPAMAAWMPALADVAEKNPILLWVVTKKLPEIVAALDDSNSRHGPALMAELVPWDEATQWSLLEQCDAVLIPSDPQDPRKVVKTANRLTDALHAGRPVIASPLPSYQPWAEFVDLSDRPATALKRLLADPQAALARVTRGQLAVADIHGTAAVVQRWLDAFVADIKPVDSGQVVEPAGDSPAAPVRLNLGCGDKILLGYVNVDVVAARAGRQPDVVCDLRNLTCFEGDSADEMMAIHVVEHFWRWEIEAVLREWVRVLKPGGRMVIEVPNLLSACEALLAHPEQGAREDQAGQRTMWVFYGDPSWQDPLMVHRWGYTPQSLISLLRVVGLTDVRQEPAQYKLREPRDMRVVGHKPAV